MYPSAVVGFNLDINETNFGKPLIGYRCILSIRNMQVLLSTSQRVQETIDLTGNDVTGITNVLINWMRFDALCLGIC